MGLRESKIQIISNNKKQHFTLMENECSNEIIKIGKTINQLQILMDNHSQFKYKKENILKLIEKMNKQKIKLTNYLDEKKIKNSNYKFKLLYQGPMKEQEYFSFVFNSNSTLLFAGGQRYIKVFKFKNGKKLLQKLTTSHGRIYCLIFMKKSNLLVSGGQSDQIVFWSQGKNSCWEPYQIIQGGDECNIKFMIANEDEDLLILYADWFGIISFWKKVNTGWKVCKYISQMSGIVSFSLNKSQTKLCMCCYNYYIIILKIYEDSKGSMEYIKNYFYGYQSCWISDSEFVFQGEQGCLDIYSLDPSYQKLFDCVSKEEKHYQINDFLQDQEEFKIKKQIKVQNTEKMYPYIPSKYLESMDLLIIQNGKFLNIFGTIGDEFYVLYQSIEFSNEFIYGNISNDGKFLVTFDRKRKTMQIRRLEYLD